MPFGRKDKAGKHEARGAAAAGVRAVVADPGLAMARGSRLEAVRMMAADLVAQIRAADDSQRLALFMQLRSVQDSIAGLKHANALVGAKASNLAWVDVWTPADV